MEFLSWSGTCQLLWMVMKSRSPAKEYALFIVWASGRERQYCIMKSHVDTLDFCKENGRNILTCGPVCRVSERRTLKCDDWVSLCFWSCFMVPLLMSSFLYSEAREHPPRWLPRHRNQWAYFYVTLNPLVSFHLSPLNVFDFFFFFNETSISVTWAKLN